MEKSRILETQLSIKDATISKMEEELRDTQKNYQKAIDTIAKKESVIIDLHEQLALFQHEVSRYFILIDSTGVIIIMKNFCDNDKKSYFYSPVSNTRCHSIGHIFF